MSQTAEILAHLQKGKSINPQQALKKWGCFRLAARIRDLKDMGYEINSRLVVTKDSKYAVYSMGGKK